MQAVQEAEKVAPGGICDVQNLLYLAQAQLAEALASDQAAAAALHLTPATAQQEAWQVRQQMLRRGCTQQP